MDDETETGRRRKRFGRAMVVLLGLLLLAYIVPMVLHR